MRGGTGSGAHATCVEGALVVVGASVTRIDQTAMGEMLIRYDNGVKGYGARNEHVEELHGTIS